MNTPFEKGKIDKAFDLLDKVYNEIPATKGCGRALLPNGCKAFCCRLQTPSMFVSEFLYLWNYFLDNSTKEEQAEVIVDAVKNYLRNKITKGCVFFDTKACRCRCHKTRPLYCRFYGIINRKSWLKKKKHVKAANFYTSDADKRELKSVLEQCDCVSTIDGRKQISEKDEEKWFEAVKEAERALGVPEETIELHDEQDGTYRSMHDHVMMMHFPPQHLVALSDERDGSPSEETIELFAQQMLEQLKSG